MSGVFKRLRFLIFTISIILNFSISGCINNNTQHEAIPYTDKINNELKELSEKAEGREKLRDAIKTFASNSSRFADSFTRANMDVFLKLEKKHGVEKSQKVIKASFGDSILNVWKQLRSKN
ncbi:MAG: hypothetical protein EBV15_07175 [Bacteroidetes bacterium]|nr:hypothetical protein [Bacteroidota bacterium]